MAITRDQFEGYVRFVHNGHLMELGSAGIGLCIFVYEGGKIIKNLPVEYNNNLGFKIRNSQSRFIIYDECTIYDDMMVLEKPKPEELYTCPCCNANYVIKNKS